jgi:putative Ca2+/H+ antiporter (TMEM165/GDT1 family)
MSAASWSFEPGLFLTAFGLVFLAELPDKTAFATMLMAARRHPVAVFLGVSGAFVVQSLVAVLFGSLLNLFPARWVRLGAGALFLFFAYRMWTHVEEAEVEGVHGWRAASFGRTVATAFVVVFLAEWGDMSQLTTAALVAKHGRPLTIYAGAASALMSVTAIAVGVGHGMKSRLHPEQISKAAAAAFAAVGLYFLLKPS